MSPSFNPVSVQATLLRELREAWDALSHSHRGETLYSFGIYTTDELDYLTVTASTEDGLRRVTREYVERDGRDSSLHARSLRWSPCDSPLHSEGDGLLTESERALGVRATGTELSEEVVAQILELCVDALNTLDEQGVFGSGSAREQLVLGVWKGDQSDEERVAFARRLNPASVVTRFERELEEGYEAFTQLFTGAG